MTVFKISMADVERSVAETNLYYGGRNFSVCKRLRCSFNEMPLQGTNVVFPFGSQDPWHALGITEYYNDYDNTVVFMHG